jgi:hypothetical protein
VAAAVQQGRQRHQQTAAGRGRPLQLEPVDRSQQVFLAVGDRLHHLRRAGKGHDRNADIGRQILNERSRSRLRRLDAAGLDIGRQHAA